VFEVAAGSGAITTLATFNGTNGANPERDLVEDSSGNLFGTTLNGGTSNNGTVFEVKAGSGTVTTLASFNGANGATPYCNLVEDSGGNLFGTTSYGGTSNVGTVFEIAAGSGTITTLATFNGTNGSHPGGLIEDSSGNLFGTAYQGGTSGNGTVFELAAGSGTITTLATFNGTNGANPTIHLIADRSGNLFGTTYSGGAAGAGTVFEVVGNNGNITLQNGTTMSSAGPFINLGTVAILDSSSLTVTGTNNTYTQQGNFGVTQVDGSLTAGQININAGLLDGSGTVNGPITISSGGFLLPGDFGSGILNTGNVTLNTGAQFLAVFNGSSNPGSAYSQLLSTGTVNLNGDNQAGSALNVALLYLPPGTGTLTIIKAANPIAGTFAGLPEGTMLNLTYNGTSYPFKISYLNDQVVLIDPLPQQAATAPGAPTAPSVASAPAAPPRLTTEQDAILIQEAITLWSAAEREAMAGQGQIGLLGRSISAATVPMAILPDGAAARSTWLAGPSGGGDDEDSEQAPADLFDLMATALAGDVQETPSRADIDAAFILK
jgi:uncharacterized repeat protein (TIGR03803 family)